MTEEGELIAGRYRLGSQVGIGAMGVVWQARDELLGRIVAVKKLLLHSGMSEIETDEANRRAMREGRIAARLLHPHAISVYDVAEHAGKPCLIMEYLSSESLSTALTTRGVLPPADVARIGSQIAAALAAAHEAGIVHRDVKPGNVLLADDGTAKITDFGISRAVGAGTVTATGVLAGTPAYFAPEVAKGQAADFPADVFSLGATLYAAVEGIPPFGLDDNALAMLYRIATNEITPPEQAGPLTPVLERLLEPNPTLRPTMQQAQEALSAVAARPPSPVQGPATTAVSPPAAVPRPAAVPA
ncbi:MAG: serine/threonine-protein kinase, partial [Pseudonocardiaceae bacterium]